MHSKLVQKWTPQLAYAVGLIVTDGCLSSDGRHIIFTSKDIDLIQIFAQILNLKNKIGETRNPRSRAYRIQFGNISLYRWFLDIGITPHKSLTIEKVAVPRKYFLDFLRGHLDGDGSITTYTDTYNTYKNPRYIYTRLFLRFNSGSLAHIKWLQKTIIKISTISGRIHTTKPNAVGNSMHILKFGKKDSIKMLKTIYYAPNLPCLARKRKIAEMFLQPYYDFGK